MRYFIAPDTALKWLEIPSVYKISKDELYELDDLSFDFFKKCAAHKGCASDNAEFIGFCLKEDLLTTTKNWIKIPKILKSPEPSLRYLELQITDRCNLRCRHCYIDENSDNELSLNEIASIFKEFEEMQGLRVMITGGEPLLHSGFSQINNILPDFMFRKVLFTNGLLLTKKILKKLNVNELQISIDGLEEAHESLRGKGTYRRSIEALRNALDAGFDVSVSSMIHKKNLTDFEEMDKLFRRIGIKDWTVDVPCITGRFEHDNEFHLSPAEAGRYLKCGYGDGLHSGAEGFGCGLHLMSVMADGKIAKCTFYSDRAVGTVSDGLRGCWAKIEPIKLNRLQCDCEQLEICRGGCRYRAELLNNPYAKDLYRCYSYDIIEPEKKPVIKTDLLMKRRCKE